MELEVVWTLLRPTSSSRSIEPYSWKLKKNVRLQTLKIEKGRGEG